MGKDFCGSEFDSIFVEALDEALSVYGEGAKVAFYEYFEKAHSISKSDIPSRIEEFSQGIEDLFGLASKNLEILVMMQLHLRIGVIWQLTQPNQKSTFRTILPDLTFEEYVKFAKKYYEEAEEYEDRNSVLVTEKQAREIYR